MKEPAKFFASIRVPQKCGPLKSSQVEGFNAVLAACSGAPLAYAAYMLATAWHETAGTMQPVKEYGGTAYFTRMYDINGDRPDKARELGNLLPGDGAKYAGRGYVQLTGKRNYAKADQELHEMMPEGQNLVSNPDLAMRPDIAAAIMRKGMEEGWFTGKKLKDYLPIIGVAKREQYMAARRIINGQDRADLIEDYAQWYEKGLREGGWA